MNQELLQAVQFLKTEKGLPADVIFESLEAVLLSAYKRETGTHAEATATIDRETGVYHIFVTKTVVENVEDPELEISLTDAQALNSAYAVGDLVQQEVTPKNFGRMAAQTAKQVMTQRLKEAERNVIYDEFVGREGDVLTGMIERIDNKTVYVSLGKTEGILPSTEQIPGERYRPKNRLKCYVVEVKKTSKGPQIILSRTHPGLLKRLFELEVPEIYDGTVEIKSVAREAGSRSKISVYSVDGNIDPVGACVGPKGQRVQNIVDELHDEKIDIVRWDEDPALYIANSLSPSKVISVSVWDEEKTSHVIVPDYQLSLAIGKAGQNARLAAKLTNWKIDIKSESQAAEDGFEDFYDDDEEDLLAELDATMGAAQSEETLPGDEVTPHDEEN
ncbi:MAG: transcription termination factor NusA [Negativicoccus massiliensis]|uniref:transcription termination factor NusA n=1 Tax=Negativicoccus succinicivorans TaxID=620903 RepID=UPI0026ED6F88|nr:transcription termination factor NusA [Negativicoccus succinicivorans]MBS5887646.1 transcription termination/antitermination protein NusA [Negativicoccus succinicivorans]MDU4642047.1 transcription termination factor NusA [Negativicoccus massiliensis]MDU5027759.1 transcription termination factor NusA [Negativicoccus succinicivorans]